MTHPDNVERLMFFASRVEEDGHLNAARHMRNAADELQHVREAVEAMTLALQVANAALSDAQDDNEALREELATIRRLTGGRF